MTRTIAVFLTIGLMVYALIDIWQTPRQYIRTLPTWAWVTLVILVPIAGPLWWLLAGKNLPASGTGHRSMRAPDDDPDFLSRLSWEQRKKRRKKKDQED